ncbi:MAG: hypothetical protein IKP47_06810 [Ruminococcus sp.]|nr:hypothetical protein [Ruminococcus sp.]
MSGKYLILLAAAALALSACGESTSSAAPIEAGTGTQSVAQTLEAPGTQASETETGLTTEPVSETAAEPETTTTPPMQPAAPVTYEDLKGTVDLNSEFQTQEGTVTFGECLEAGRGNVIGDGIAYCLVPMGTAAGHIYFANYYTVNGGGSWVQSGQAEFDNGRLQTFAAEDGRVVVSDDTVNAENKFPVVYILCIEESSEGYEFRQTVKQDYYKAFDGICEGRLCSAALTYGGDYKLGLVLTDKESGETVFEGQTVLDRDTLEPALPDAAS